MKGIPAHILYWTFLVFKIKERLDALIFSHVIKVPETDFFIIGARKDD